MLGNLFIFAKRRCSQSADVTHTVKSRRVLPALLAGALLSAITAGSAFAALISTDNSQYITNASVSIDGSTFSNKENVSLQVTYLDGSPLVGAAGDVWVVSADSKGDFLTSWTAPLLQTATTLLLTAVGTVTGDSATATFAYAPPAVNLDQLRNGSAASPVDPGDWVNGNLGPSNSHYVEEWSGAYRAVMTDMPIGDTITLTLEYDIKHSDKNAIDYLTHYDRIDEPTGVHLTGLGHSPEEIDPTDGVAGIVDGSSPFDTEAIPAPTVDTLVGAYLQPTTSFNALPAGDKVMSLWGGEFVASSAISYPTPAAGESDLSASNSSTRIDVTFVVDSSTMILAWGGHIGSRNDWGYTLGVPNSAGGISGSPYHMRIDTWNLGNTGNQDRSLSAGAVLAPPPPSCSLSVSSLDVCAGTDTCIVVAASLGSPPYTYSWTGPNGFVASSDTACLTNLQAADAGTYIVTVTDTLGLSCESELIVTVNTPPVVSCPSGPIDMFVCDLSDICIPGFSYTDADGDTATITVNGGTLSGDTVCFTPVAGANVIQFIASDACGADTCEVTVNVTLNTPPTAACPADQALFVCDLSDICLPGFTSSDIDGNISSVTVDNGALSGDTVCFTPVIGANVITQIVTDSCGAADTCVTTITVALNSGPTASCPGDTSMFVADLSDICLVGFLGSDPNNNIATVTVDNGTLDGDSVCFTPVVGGNLITLVVTDSCGLADTCVVNVNIGVNSPPVCPPSTLDTSLFLCAPEEICLPINVSDPDNNLSGCTILSGPGVITGDSIWCYTPLASGVDTVSIECVDSLGATCSFSFIVTVDLNSAPTATCAADVALFVCDLSDICLTGFSASDVDGNLVGATVDNGTLAGDSVCFTPVAGVNTITYVATDACGAVDTCVTTVSVTLNTAPTVSCPANAAATLCGPEEICVGPFTSGDVDGNLSSTTYSFGTESAGTVCFTPDTAGVYTIVATATDACGEQASCTTTVTVDYFTPPSVADVVENVGLCGPGVVCVALPTASGGAAPYTYTVDGVAKTDTVCYALSGDTVIVNQVIVTDSCGRTDTATITVNAAVNTAPVASTTDLAARFICSPTDTVCVKLSITDPDNGPTGTSLLGWYNTADTTVCFVPGASGNFCDQVIVSDSCGLTDTLDFCIDVTLNTPPTCAVPADTTIFACDLSDICIAGFSCNDVDGNLSSESVNTGSLNAGEVCFTPVEGANQIILTCTDACGAQSSCTTTVTVTLNSPPTVSCPANAAFTLCGPEEICVGTFSASDVDGNIASETFSFGTPGAGDVCFTPDTAGVYSIIYTATDDCGEIAECTTTVTVDYSAPPTLAGATHNVALCDTATVCVDVPTASGGEGTLNYTVDGSPAGAQICVFLGSSGSHNFEVIVTDSCGNADTATVTVNATVNGAPVISSIDESAQFICDIGDTVCLPFSVVDPDNGLSGTSSAGWVNMADSTVCFIANAAGQTCGDLIISDSCGLADTANWCVTVNANAAPTCSTPNDTTLFVCDLSEICLAGFDCTDPDGNLTSSTVNNGTLSAGEVCFTPVAGANQIILTCTDACGAQSSCTTTVTVALNSPPEVTCAASTERTLCGPEEICVGPFSSSDPDGNLLSTSSNLGTFSGSNVCFTPDTAGIYTIRAIATDVCGLADTCETQIAVDFTNPPQFGGNSITNAGLVCASGQVCVPLPAVVGGNAPLNYTISGDGVISGDSVCFNLSAGANSLSAQVIVTDDCGKSDTVSVTYNADVNRPPVVSCPPAQTISVCDVNATVCVSGFESSDPDNNIDTSFVIGATLSNGSACFAPGAPGDYILTMVTRDECGVERTCQTTVTVEEADFAVCNACPTVTIEKAHGVLQGHQICLSVTSEGSARDISGYDLLIAYDASALTALGADPGSHIDICGWEYFTYRFGANGNCGTGCPTGILRLTALAETNNGDNHPICFGPGSEDPIQLAEICFLVSNDRTLECQYAAVRFFWMDCGDNVFSDITGDTLYVSDVVLDYDNVTPINDPTAGFPTYFGIQAECMVGGGPGKPTPLSCVTFQNGGVDIICADSIDARGDVNLNGLDNEIADVVMFTEYFISGLAAFGTHVEGSIAASEVNGDGIPLTVADLVYLIRVIVGDAQPLPKLTPYETKVDITAKAGGVFETSTDLGAALFVFKGDVEVTLLQDQMNLLTGTRDGKTYALIVADLSAELSATITAGDLISAEGVLVSVEASDIYGALADVTLGSALPVNFALHQNYPNPFNPQTTITFNLPKSQAYELAVYNLSGQKVAEFMGVDQGTVRVVWEAGERASGLYFYKLTTGDFSQTRKMILLK